MLSVNNIRFDFNSFVSGMTPKQVHLVIIFSAISAIAALSVLFYKLSSKKQKMTSIDVLNLAKTIETAKKLAQEAQDLAVKKIADAANKAKPEAPAGETAKIAITPTEVATATALEATTIKVNKTATTELTKADLTK